MSSNAVRNLLGSLFLSKKVIQVIFTLSPFGPGRPGNPGVPSLPRSPGSPFGPTYEILGCIRNNVEIVSRSN